MKPTSFCMRCKKNFEVEIGASPGYCDACIEWFGKQREKIHQRQNPAPDVHCVGKFASGSPRTFIDEEDRTRCGLCGSDDIEPGYGLGSGYGMGSYNFCMYCNSFLDFREDAE